jgi:hypothetical protein
MTRSFKVLSEAHAAIQKLGPDRSGSLIGYEDGDDVIVLSVAPSGCDQGKLFYDLNTLANKFRLCLFSM